MPRRRKPGKDRPGLFKHVLTLSWFSGPGCCWYLPSFIKSASGCAPELAFAYMAPSSKFLDLLPAPLPPVQKTGHTAQVFATQWVGDRDRGGGGVKSPETRGGVKISNFQQPLKLTPFYRDSIENRQFGGVKSPSLRGATFGLSSPPSSVRYVLTPPPLSRSPNGGTHRGRGVANEGGKKGKKKKKNVKTGLGLI